ncbi:hypothetical protein JKP88DRAFT_244806 [Tribonema minus]|uniref:Uncharacterized protein n=1 Tax=Tribonema minus TaxID=303371 RepID=A0A835Z7X8_9STRA|nr:hypothetical protein JKP88DRAFT_244806 [Tribonema minus]
MQLLCWVYRCGKQRIDRFYCLEHRIQSAVLPAYTAGDDMDCKEQESVSAATTVSCDIGCKESANVYSSVALKGSDDVASDRCEEEERSAKHAADAIEKDGSKKAQRCAVIATGTAAGNDLGSLLPHIAPSIIPAAMQKPCLVHRCGKQRIDRFYCLEHRMQSAVKYDAPVDDMDCREQESSSTATNACGDNVVAEMCKTSTLEGFEDTGADSTLVASAPINTYISSKKSRPLRVDDVNADEIPAMAHLADKDAARQKREEEERNAKRVAAAAAKEEGRKKARKESVMAGDATAGNGHALSLPHTEPSEISEEPAVSDSRRRMSEAQFLACMANHRLYLAKRVQERRRQKQREKRKKEADQQQLCAIDMCGKVAHGEYCTAHRIAIAASLLPGGHNTSAEHIDCNKQGKLSSADDLCCNEGISGQVATLQQLSLSTQQEIANSVLAVTCADSKRCSKCQIIKALTSFHKDNQNKDGLQSYCKECNRQKYIVRINTRKGFVYNLVANTQQRSNRRGMSQNKLTAAVFDDICRTQNDRCVYSGLPVTFTPMSDWQASIERLNDDEDYLVENSALCALEFNVRAGWTVAKARYAATHTDSVDAATVEANVREALCKPPTSRRARGLRQQKEEQGVIIALCDTCCVWKPQNDFYECTRTICKGCMISRAKQYGSTWRGAFFILVNNATKRCKVPTREARGLVCDITFEDLANMYRDQCGVCSYSGIPLTTEGDWKVSLERRDVRVGYTRENCCLIAMEFQSADLTAVSKYEGTGCAGWSLQKYEYFRANYDPANVPVRRPLALVSAPTATDTIENTE